jgi:hypothetical protein
VRGSTACPVKAVKAWLAASGICEGPLFRPVAKGGRTRPSAFRAWLGHVSLDTTSIYAETDMATKKRALATLDQGRTRKTSGGWSRRPEVMEFLRSL